MGKLSSAMDWLHLGLGPLDRDIREIHMSLDRLEAMLAERDAEGARRQVQMLIQRGERHFRREQALLRRQGFPRLHEHARCHEAALLLLENLDACLARGDLAGAVDSCDDLSSFVDCATRRYKAEYAAFLASLGPPAAHSAGP